jgi:hypothetical protein
LIKLGLIEDRLKCKTLNDIAKDSVLEAVSWKKSATSKGEAILISVIETIYIQNKEQRETTTIMIPLRFETDCEKVPCLLYYAGKKPSKKGQDYHDLKFIKPDDKDVFHTCDNDLDMDKTNSIQSPTPPPPPPPTPATPALNIYCLVCDNEGLVCPGFCGKCGEHLPKDGLRCRCLSH